MRLLARPIKEIFAEFPASEQKLPEVRSFIESLLTETPFRRKDITAMLLAIEEACTNVIRHAYLYGEGTLRLRVTLHSDKIQISIFDRGRSFDFEKSSDPNLEHYIKTGRKGGLGVYLIRKITDDVSYHTKSGVNELRMIKNYPKVRPTAMARTGGVSLRVKFSLWTSLVMSILIITAYFYWEKRSVNTLRTQFRDVISEYSTAIASQAANFFINNSSDVEFDEFVRNFASRNRDILYIYILDRDGRVVASTKDPEFLHLAYGYPEGIKPDLIGQIQVSTQTLGPTTYYVTENVLHQSRSFGTAHIGYSDQRLGESIASSQRGILLVVGAAFIFSMLAVYFLANYFVRPIQKLIDGVRRFGRGDLDGKISIEGAGEFNAIAEAFNEMTVKVKDAQKQLVEQEKMRKEMQVAQDIQHALLPRQFPDIEGFDIATVYRAAKDVGGDYYDFVWIDPKTLGIVVADVSGKGVPGSLVMTMIRTAIRLESRGNRSAVDILSRVNDFVTEDVRKGMFVTIFLVLLDTTNRRISFASAGHNPMILYRRDEDKTYFLNPKGIPLGITLPEGISFEENLSSESVRLKRDDMLLIYTDGITEAMNEERRQYGIPRFLEFVRDNADLTPDEFMEKFHDELRTFTGNAEQNDDITMVVIKEKIEADQYIFARRKKLLELVEMEGRSVTEACRLMNMSPSTYYRYKKRFELHGDEGLLNKTLRVDESPSQLSYQQRNRVLEIIRQHPDFGAARIRKELEGVTEGQELPDDRTIYSELVRLRLNSKRQRYEYVSRMGGILTADQREEFEKLTEAIAEPGKTVDRKAYVEQLKDAIRVEQEEKDAAIRERFVHMGLGADRIDILSAMFAEMEDEVSPDELNVLVERVSRRLKRIDLEAEKKNVLSTARIEELESEGWLKKADEGINLEVISLPNEEEGFNFKDYERKLAERKDKDSQG